MSVFYEIIVTVIGRWVLGTLGYLIKKAFYFFTGSKYERKKTRPKANDMLDMEEFGNCAIGLITVFLTFFIIGIFT